MYILNFQTFESLFTNTEEFDEEGRLAERKAIKDLLYDVICNRDNINQCDDLSYDILLDLLDSADSIVGDYDKDSAEKEKVINKVMGTRGQQMRRFI